MKQFIDLQKKTAKTREWIKEVWNIDISGTLQKDQLQEIDDHMGRPWKWIPDEDKRVVLKYLDKTQRAKVSDEMPFTGVRALMEQNTANNDIEYAKEIALAAYLADLFVKFRIKRGRILNRKKGDILSPAREARHAK